MKKIFEKPELIVVLFANDDVIMTSYNPYGDDGDEGQIIFPTSQP